MKIPGPDHPITLTPATTRWRAEYEGHLIADTADALVLQESTYKPVVYFPRADVSMDFLARTEHATHCPYKGDASYYSLMMDGHLAENAVWTYEQPFPAMEAIRERVAFYPNLVRIYEVAAGADRTDVDEVIQHTDSGSGASQKPHWPSTVDEPRPEGV